MVLEYQAPLCFCFNFTRRHVLMSWVFDLRKSLKPSCPALKSTCRRQRRNGPASSESLCMFSKFSFSKFWFFWENLTGKVQARAADPNRTPSEAQRIIKRYYRKRKSKRELEKEKPKVVWNEKFGQSLQVSTEPSEDRFLHSFAFLAAHACRPIGGGRGWWVRGGWYQRGIDIATSEILCSRFWYLRCVMNSCIVWDRLKMHKRRPSPQHMQEDKPADRNVGKYILASPNTPSHKQRQGHQLGAKLRRESKRKLSPQNERQRWNHAFQNARTIWNRAPRWGPNTTWKVCFFWSQMKSCRHSSFDCHVTKVFVKICWAFKVLTSKLFNVFTCLFLHINKVSEMFASRFFVQRPELIQGSSFDINFGHDSNQVAAQLFESGSVWTRRFVHFCIDKSLGVGFDFLGRSMRLPRLKLTRR